MAELHLLTETGRPLGSRASRRLRREAKVPGVLYGLEADPIALAVNYSELRQVLTTDAGLNALISLEVDGQRHLSLVKELQRHPVRDEVIHVDFVRIDATAELSVDVPIVLEGDARKVTDENGMVDQTLFMLTIFSSPDAIPNELVVDISELELNGAIRVGDIALPAGVRTEVDAEEPVAVGTVTRSTMESMAEDEAAEAAAEEGSAGGASDDGGDD
ncbi:MAG: 50S ribosomal protein L25 [Acidimicrobiales bacterium]